MVVWLFLAVPWVCLRFVVFPDHTHLLSIKYEIKCVCLGVHYRYTFIRVFVCSLYFHVCVSMLVFLHAHT